MYKIHFPDIRDFEEMTAIGEQIFKTEGDDTQSKASVENCLSISKIDKYCYLSVKDGDINIAWTIVLPTSKENMDKFLNKEITEAELSEYSKVNPCSECLYFMVAVTVPEYRGRGLATFLFEEQIKYFIGKYKINNFFGWIFSEEGKALAQKLKQKVSGVNVFILDR